MLEPLLDALLEGHAITAVGADKAYDSDAIRERLQKEQMEAVIPSKANRVASIPHDKEAYKLRSKVERFFNKMKWFRRIATRYDKLSETFLAAVKIVAAFLIIRSNIRKNSVHG